jgi:hypothetical protein
MDWLRRFGCNLMHSILAGVVFSALYYGLLFTRTFHGLAVSALDPAFYFQYRHDPYFDIRWSTAPKVAWVEHLAVNAFLYAFWILVLLTAVDLFKRIERKIRGAEARP